MDSKVNYTVVGIFVVLLGAVMIVLALWFTSLKHTDTYTAYVTYFREEVAGLSVQSPVRFNGVKVGYVAAIDLNQKDPQQVRIVMKIIEGTPVTTSTVAILTSEGITGIDYVGLKALTPDAPMLTAKEGQEYPVIPSQPSLLVKLGTALTDVTDSLKVVSERISMLFDAQNRKAIASTLANIDKLTKSVADNSKNIDLSLQSAQKLLTNTAQASKELPEIMKKVQSTLSSVTQAADQFNKASTTANVTLRDARSAVQGTSQQVVPQLQQLMSRLNAIARNLQQFSSDLRRNPSILVRGKQLPTPGPGER